MSDPAKILLVDDDPVTLRVLEKALKAHGAYQVRTATDGVKGLSEAISFCPDLILSDKVMPEMDGIELCRQVRANTKLASTLFVILSATSDPRALAEALETGADSYLLKPLPFDEVRTRVRSLLRARRASGQQEESAPKPQTDEAAQIPQFIRLLLNLEDMLQPGAGNSAIQMASAAQWMAEKLDLPEENRSQLEIAAYLHRLGATVLPGLQPEFYPFCLRGSDWEVYRSYPAISQALLRHVEAFQPAGDMIRSLLENWDGSGFPDHLQQTQIPLPSRILRVLADFFFDPAMIARPESREQLLARMAERSGLVYDPVVFQSFVDFVRRELSETLSSAQRYVPVSELRPGMKLATDLVTPSGRLLLRENEILSPAVINGILRFHAIDPFPFNICIYPAPEAAKAD